MRKAHMQAVIDGLKKHNEDLRGERDSALSGLRQSLAGLHGVTDAALREVTACREEMAGLAASVRASLLARAEPEAPAVTPIKRGSKAAL